MNQNPNLIAPLCGIAPDAVLGLHTGKGDLPAAIAAAVHTGRIAAIHPTAVARRSDTSTIIAPLIEAYGLLAAVSARFDFIAATPPVGETWPCKGLVLPQRPNLIRRFVADNPTVDSVYACWLIANYLLTPAGEGVIVADPVPLRTVLTGCPYASRIWLWLELPDGKLAAYFGASHRAVLESAPTVKGFVASFARFTGERITSAKGNAFKASLDRFEIARAEHVRQKTGELTPHVSLNAKGCFVCQSTAFERISGRVPPALADALNAINGKRPLDFVTQATTLRELRQTVTAPNLRVADGVIQAINAAEQENTLSATPFNRPTNAQAVAWLDNENQVRCSADFFSFRRGERYSVSSQMFEGVKMERRLRLDSSVEDVEVSGMELAIIVTDHLGARYAFTQHPLNDRSRKLLHAQHGHQLADLLSHFEMPDVPDVYDRDPMRFNQLAAKLRKLERAKDDSDPFDRALAELEALSPTKSRRRRR